VFSFWQSGKTDDQPGTYSAGKLGDALAQVAPSPVVELNRAVAVAMAFGPATGLELVDRLGSEPSLQG
jgi:predicted RNA polymerase sigma factor